MQRVAAIGRTHDLQAASRCIQQHSLGARRPEIDSGNQLERAPGAGLLMRSRSHRFLSLQASNHPLVNVSNLSQRSWNCKRKQRADSGTLAGACIFLPAPRYLYTRTFLTVPAYPYLFTCNIMFIPCSLYLLAYTFIPVPPQSAKAPRAAFRSASPSDVPCSPPSHSHSPPASAGSCSTHSS